MVIRDSFIKFDNFGQFFQWKIIGRHHIFMLKFGEITPPKNSNRNM
jgi:hypothetical protein